MGDNNSTASYLYVRCHQRKHIKRFPQWQPILQQMTPNETALNSVFQISGPLLRRVNSPDQMLHAFKSESLLPKTASLKRY